MPIRRLQRHFNRPRPPKSVDLIYTAEALSGVPGIKDHSTPTGGG